jgi:hypothetical protein
MAFEFLRVEDIVMGRAGDVKYTYDGGSFNINEDFTLRMSIKTMMMITITNIYQTFSLLSWY